MPGELKSRAAQLVVGVARGIVRRELARRPTPGARDERTEVVPAATPPPDAGESDESSDGSAEASTDHA
jgi:hypothetical protein